MTRRLVAILAFLALTTGAALSDPVFGRLKFLILGNPVPADTASVAKGAALFAAHCAACHGERGDGRGELANDLPTPPADFSQLNRPPSVMAMRISFGVGETMPAWRDNLAETDIWHLVNFLETLANEGRGRQRNRWLPVRN